MLIYLFVFLWLLIGWLCWQAGYYSIIKAWYYKFNEDLRQRNAAKNCLNIFRILSPLFIAGGLITFFVMLPDILKKKIPFEYGVTLYFKIPKNDSGNKESIQARDN